MTLKRFIKKLHLWIGLPGAILFFIICITGSIFVFSDEVIDISGKKYSTVEKTGHDWIPFDQMIDSIDSAYPNNLLTFLTVNKAENSSMRFLIVYNHGLQDIFMNPYTGEILGDSRVVQFFYIIGHLHSMLLWHGPGEWIVKIATILFFIALISGLIIWWPKRKDKKALKNAFVYKRNRPFKRRIFDLHRVWGFYGLGILLLLTVTGIIIAFEPLSGAVSRAGGGDPTQGFVQAYPADTTKTKVDIRPVLKRYLQQPGVEEIQMGLFFFNRSSVFRLHTGSKMRLLTFNGDAHLIDKYTGEEINNQGITENIEVENTLMNLHTGKYLGWVGLILSFLGGLLGAFLSVTGVLLWLQKFI